MVIMKNILGQILLCVVFVGLGVIFILMGNNMKAKNNELKEKCTGEVQGIVAKFDVSGYVSDDSDERLYYPIFEYEVNDKTYSKRSPTGQRQKRFETGEKITIMYNPANPDEYYVPSDEYALKTAGYNIGFGIFIIAVFVVLVVVNVIKKVMNNY